MEEKADMFSINNDDETAENIRRSISYLKGLPSDNDRLAFVESTPDFVGWMTSNFVGDDEGEKSIKEALDDKSEKVKLYERDEQGNRVLSRKELAAGLGLDDDTATLGFDPASEDSWFRKSKPELKQIAESLGVSYPALIKAYSNESYKQGREQAINDGTASSFILRHAFPRITESAKAGRDISTADKVLDFVNLASYAMPYSTGVKALTKAGRLASVVSKNAAAPLLEEAADAAAYKLQEANGGDKNERSNFSVKDVATRTGFNFGSNGLSHFSRMGLSTIFRKLKNSTNDDKKLKTAMEAYDEGMKAYGTKNDLTEKALKNKGAKEFGTLKNVETFLTKEENDKIAEVAAKNVSENAALNNVVQGIAGVIAKNPKKKWTLQDASKEFWASISPAKRKEIYEEIEKNAEEGVRMFENNGGKWYTFNRRKNMPLATDQFKKYAEGSPLGSVYKMDYRNPVIPDEALAMIVSYFGNILGKNEFLNETIAPAPFRAVGNGIDYLRGENNTTKAINKRNEMKRKQGIWVKKMQDDYKKAMGN